MTKLLYYGDYTGITGFSIVASNILKRLSPKEFQIDVVAVNYYGKPFDQEEFPGRVYPATSPQSLDLYGRKNFIDRIYEVAPDTVFIIQDPFIIKTYAKDLIQAQNDLGFKLVIYFPVDAYARWSWFHPLLESTNLTLIAYTEYAKARCLEVAPEFKDCIEVIYHGINPVFKRIGLNERMAFRESLQISDKTFVLLNVNRNQSRKDIARSLMVLSELKNKGEKDFFLYLHMSPQDIGGDFTLFAADLNLRRWKDYDYPSALSPEGVSEFRLNHLYNMADALITTSRGEGFGLSVGEAIRVGLPVVAPDHSALSEVLGEGSRGILVKAGANSSLWTVMENDNELLRPLVDVDDMSDKLIKLKNNEYDVDTMTNVAKQFAEEELNWNKLVSERWVPILKS